MTPSWTSSFNLRLFAAVWTGMVLRLYAQAGEVLPGDAPLASYFREETQRLEESSLTGAASLAEWEEQRPKLHRELLEMLSLSPLPERSEMSPVITGQVDHSEFTVEKLHFQSMPGLYVTANLYLPKSQTRPVPAVLYVCGHAQVMTNGVSYGNKTAYQHHAIWFARNGYACLILDTIQLGEIPGVHHGTYREGMWWWNSRGYSPAGVEAWNCIRALDYLQSRPEVDGTRLGVTGRSGGGAYSWWVAALDDRIKVAAPVAGITDLENHVVDGVVEGHCDCMFLVNTYRWDYPTVAALVAPRPLLICNSDKDSIFPLDGVVRLHAKVANIYRLYNATNQLGLLITEGPHKDTQDLQLPVFRWFNRHLKGEDPIIEMAATRQFTPDQLKVFDRIPPGERTSSIHDSFVPKAGLPEVPGTTAQWTAQRDVLMNALREKVFRGWPAQPPPLAVSADAGAFRNSDQLAIHEFTSDHHVRLRLYILQHGGAERLDPRTAGGTSRPAAGSGPATVLRLKVCDETEWRAWIQSAAQRFPEELQRERALRQGDWGQGVPSWEPTNALEVCFAPRGLGLDAWSGEDRKQRQIRRRFMLLGQTVEGMRVWDIRRAIQAIRSLDALRGVPIVLEASGTMAVNALYASLFESGLGAVQLRAMPTTHSQGPDYLNILRVLDIPQAVALAMEQSQVLVSGASVGDWAYPKGVGRALAWPTDRFQTF